ncbi:MAG: aminotransferase class III-fold pyridoxal phosphate-dependent enzyme, partial [Halobacteriota archaeon]
GSHASTFAGNNISCAAGLAVLDIMNSKGFGDHVISMGEHLLGRLDELQQDYGLIGNTRGMGLMAAIELVRSRTTKEPAVEEGRAILTDAFESGLALLPAGESTIRFCPPLTITPDDIDTAVEILRGALERVK